MTNASIRARLLALVLLSVMVVWSIALAWSYRQTDHEVREWDNARLVQLAALLARLDEADLARIAVRGIDVRNEYGHASGHQTDADADGDGDKQPRSVLVEVRGADGGVIARSAAFDRVIGHATQTGPSKAVAHVLPDAARGSEELPPDAFSSFDVDGVAWHRYIARDAASGRSITMLEPALTHSDLVSGVAGRIARPMLVALPMLALLIWVSIGRSLAPLAALSRAVATRDATRLEPITIAHGPLEVRPLVMAINDLMARLRATFARERAFTSDAAHELKTPLAAIKVQAQVALLAEDPAQLRLAMERVVQGVDRSARLAEQLLLLARLDEQEKIAATEVDVCEIAREALAARQAELDAKRMTQRLDAQTQARVQADATLLRILIDDLLDNSIKYCQTGGRIVVRIREVDEPDAHREGGPHVVLAVADDGPGVTPAERERITDRFFRGSSVTTRGSGLGLSIVARIAACFGATLRFGPGIGDRGLGVEVTFVRVTEADRHGSPTAVAPGADRAGSRAAGPSDRGGAPCPDRPAHGLREDGELVLVQAQRLGQRVVVDPAPDDVA